jgi:hydrogenase maturation protease
MTTGKWLVAGVGNPLLGSDGFGPAVIQSLREQTGLPATIELEDARPDLLALTDRVSAFDGVVLVDAVLGSGPREVTVVGEATFGAWNAASPNAHAVSPLLALNLFRALHPGERTRFVLVGLVVNAIDTTSPPTPAEVRAGADAVLQVVTASSQPGADPI